MLREAAYDSARKKTFRRIAIKALGYGFGKKAALDLENLLTDKDVHIREATVFGLGFIDTPHVKRVLEGRLSVEETITVRLAIEKVLKQLGSK